MNFIQFAEAHGLIITHLIYDKWVRVPTVDHPHKKNGSYIFDGRSGAVRNFAMHDKPVSWMSKEPHKHDPFAQERKKKAEKERLDKQEKASKKAGWIMNQVKESTHPYLAKKGFPTQKGYVWNGLLVLPMREGDKLMGCQLIDKDGTKKFLSGQKTKGVSLKIDNKGRNILCEGFATALSIRRAMKYLKMRYTLHICFSASNMVEIAKQVRDPFVVSDNDSAGLNATHKVTKNFWVSDQVSEDFNDAEARLGTEAVALSLGKLLNG